MERTARTAAAERTGSFFMNDMDRFPSLYKYHACGRRQKNCIQSAALQFKSNIRETWRVILVSEADIFLSESLRILAELLESYSTVSQFILPYLSVISWISFCNFNDNCLVFTLHFQFFPTVDGVLIRQLFPSPK